MDMEGNAVRVIKGAGFWAICSGLDGSICVTHGSDATGDNVVVNVINLATGNVLMASKELNYGGPCNFSVGRASPSGT
jgi:hypothetical protein